MFACTAVAGKTVYAAPNDTIQTGISADGMDLSGMTQEQAQGAVQSLSLIHISNFRSGYRAADRPGGCDPECMAQLQ